MMCTANDARTDWPDWLALRTSIENVEPVIDWEIIVPSVFRTKINGIASRLSPVLGTFDKSF